MRAVLIFVSILFFSPIFCQTDTFATIENISPIDSFQIAYDELSEIIATDSTDANALIERADLVSGLYDEKYFQTIFGNKKIYEEALADYSKAIEIDPYKYRAYFKRGLLKERFLFYKEAVEDYDEAYTYAWAKDSKMKIRVNRARIKAQLGEFDVAIKDLERALLEDRENHALLNTLALIHLDLKEYSKSLKYLNRSLEFYPDDAVTFSNIGFVALNKGKFEQAITIYDEQIAKDSTHSYMFSNRGLSKFKLGKTEEAIADLNKAIELEPINSFAYKNRAIVFFEMKKNKEGCADLQTAKKLGYTIEYNDEVIKMLFDKCLNVNKKPKR